MSHIKVLLVDDSAVVRQVLTDVLGKDPQIEIMGAVADPIFALKRMQRQWPDVIVLDMEMPRMDGLTFLRKLMSERPTPVVVCSTLTQKGTEVTLQAMAAGAVEVIAKPSAGLRAHLQDASHALIQAVKAASQAKVSAKVAAVNPPQPRYDADAVLPAPGAKAIRTTTERVVAMGTSTGGTQALERVLTRLSADCPGLVVVQHMPERFTAAFAARLNNLCKIEVKEAQSGDRVINGRALIAPGGKHTVLKRSGAKYHVEVIDGPLVSRHRPSVDVLFRSAARVAGMNALGMIMTGMGDDGARGLLEMKVAGAHTIAQDEQSCIVFGMPKEAIRRGGVSAVHPLDEFAQRITQFGTLELRPKASSA